MMLKRQIWLADFNPLSRPCLFAGITATLSGLLSILLTSDPVWPTVSWIWPYANELNGIKSGIAPLLSSGCNPGPAAVGRGAASLIGFIFGILLISIALVQCVNAAAGTTNPPETLLRTSETPRAIFWMTFKLFFLLPCAIGSIAHYWISGSAPTANFLIECGEQHSRVFYIVYINIVAGLTLIPLLWALQTMQIFVFGVAGAKRRR
jgi:hypothetical protein